MIAPYGTNTFPSNYRFDTPAVDITAFVPALVAALKDPEPEQRLAAAQVLCSRADRVPADARDAVFDLFRDPAVKKLMNEKDGFLFRAPDLSQFGAPGAHSLVALLDSDSTAVRRFAVKRLGESRALSATALPRLRELADDADTGLALAAAYTAAWVSLDPKDAAPLASRRFLRSADPEVRAAAANHLEWLGSVGAAHLDALVPLLDDKNDEIVQAAAEAIHSRAPKGSVAARALASRKLVQDEGGRFVPAPEGGPRQEQRQPTVAELLEVATAGDDWLRADAVLDLGDRGTAAKGAVPTLKKLLFDPDPELRFAAGYALARIGGDVPALQKLLTNGLERAVNGRPALWVVATAFERLPPDFPDLLPAVARWLGQRTYDRSLSAGLAKYGPQAKVALPALRKIVRGPEKPQGHAHWGFDPEPACRAIGAIGPDARDALPELRQLLDSGDIACALAARDAIQKITGGK